MDDKSIVSVKIMDVDSSDYQLDISEKDQAIKDFRSETSILNNLKQSQAKNINIMLEAFSFYSQLWIITEYCPGGSVHTLMRAWDGNRLDEKHIVAVARELAIAIKSVHDVGIIHRDIKAANVLIREDGQVQLCDFGVAAVLESNFSKRQTFIGTPFWMPPEMHDQMGATMLGGYGQEVDIWAYGCTIYEMATGKAPNTNINPERLHLFLKRAPRLEGVEYSEGLRDFVAFCLVLEPHLRPGAIDILGNPYMKASEMQFPTALLKELVERYTVWEMSGGERASLFNAFGAQGPEALPELPKDDDDWNFSMTDEFGEEIITQIVQEAEEIEAEEDTGPIPPGTISYDRGERERQIKRGERKLTRLFDLNQRPYEYNNDEPDLPDREELNISHARGSVIDIDIDIDMDDPNPPLGNRPAPENRRESNGDFYGDLGDDADEHEFYGEASYQLEKRSTAEWQFPSHGKRATAEWKFPLESEDDNHTTGVTSERAEDARRTTREWKFPFPTDSEPVLKQSDDDLRFPNGDDDGDDGVGEEKDVALDFKFPSPDSPINKRKTTEWSFSTAQYVNDVGGSHSFDDILSLPPQHVDENSVTAAFRPTLKHTTTAPVGQAITNPREKSGPGEFDVSSRFGSIDLDATEDVIQEDHSMASYTAGALDESFSSCDSRNDEPFGLDESPSIETQKPHRSNRFISSLSRFEPTPDTEEEEQREDRRSQVDQAVRQRKAPLRDFQSEPPRGPSVKASMDVLRRRNEEDDDDDNTSSNTLTQKRVTRGDSRPQKQLFGRSTDDLNGTVRRANAPPSLTVDTSTMKKMSLGRAEQRTVEKLGRKTPKQLFEELPDISAVDPAALEDGASKETMCAELKRLWGGLKQNLEVAEQLIRTSSELEEQKVTHVEREGQRDRNWELEGEVREDEDEEREEEDEQDEEGEG